MAYQDYHWNRYGVTCTSDSVWVPGTGGGDVNDGTRDQITNAYYSLFGRYGELGGIEYHVDLWVNKGGKDDYGTYASIEEMVKHTGNSAEGGTGEWNNVQNIGKHTGLAPGFCPTPTPEPVYGCTDPNATNYNPNAEVDDGSCTYPIRPYVNINGSWTKSKNVYIKDAGSWKLCRSGYIKDGGVWKPFLQF